VEATFVRATGGAYYVLPAYDWTGSNEALSDAIVG